MPVDTSGCTVAFLRRESSTRGWVGWLSTRWVGGEEGQPTRRPQGGMGGLGIPVLPAMCRGVRDRKSYRRKHANPLPQARGPQSLSEW